MTADINHHDSGDAEPDDEGPGSLAFALVVAHAGTDEDPRSTRELIADILQLLHEYGYGQPADEADRTIATGRAVEPLLHLVRAVEGRAVRVRVPGARLLLKSDESGER